MLIQHVYKRAFLILHYIFLLSTGYIATSCQSDPYKPLYGRWKIYKYTPLYTTIGTGVLDEGIIHRYILGKEITLNKHHITADGVRYENPNYKVREEKDVSTYFYWSWHVSEPDIEAIGIRDNTTNIKILEICLDDKWTWPTINFPSKDGEACLNINELIYYNGELGMCEDWYFFHLKKVR
jgi:hypothetical protein